MLVLATAFAGGVLVLQFCATLPPTLAYLLVPVVSCLLAWRLARPVVGPVLAFLLGFFWATWQAQSVLRATFPAALEGRTQQVE